MTSAGIQANPGYTPSANINTVICNNREHGGDYLFYAQSMGIINLLISNNIGGAIQINGGQLTNAVYSGNQGMSYTDCRSLGAGQYPLDLVNNNFATFYEDGDGDWFSNPTNNVTYALGRLHALATTGANVFHLDDSDSKIPTGAMLQITNSDCWHDHYPVRVQTSLKGGATYMIPVNSMWTFYWNGSSWQTGILVPPQGLKISLHP